MRMMNVWWDFMVWAFFKDGTWCSTERLWFSLPPPPPWNSHDIPSAKHLTGIAHTLTYTLLISSSVKHVKILEITFGCYTTPAATLCKYKSGQFCISHHFIYYSHLPMQPRLCVRFFTTINSQITFSYFPVHSCGRQYLDTRWEEIEGTSMGNMKE